jgi:hypothetical protein
VLVKLNDFDFNERNFNLTTDPFFEALNLSEYNTNRNVVKSELFQFQLGLNNGTFLIQNLLNKAHPNFLIRIEYITKKEIIFHALSLNLDYSSFSPTR